MRTYIRTLLAALGRVLVDRFEQSMNAPGCPDTFMPPPPPPMPFARTIEGPHDFTNLPQIKPPTRWHRVSPPTETIKYAHCKVCGGAAPWPLVHECPGVKS